MDRRKNKIYCASYPTIVVNGEINANAYFDEDPDSIGHYCIELGGGITFTPKATIRSLYKSVILILTFLK